MEFDPRLVFDAIVFLTNLIKNAKKNSNFNETKIVIAQEKLDYLKKVFIQIGSSPQILITLKELHNTLSAFHNMLPLRNVYEYFKLEHGNDAWDVWYNSTQGHQTAPLNLLRTYFKENSILVSFHDLKDHFITVNNTIEEIERLLKKRFYFNDSQILMEKLIVLQTEIAGFLTDANQSLEKTINSLNSLANELQKFNIGD